MCSPVGRHSLARERRKPSVGVTAAILAPAAAFLAVGTDIQPPELVAEAQADQVVDAAPRAMDTAPLGMQVIAVAPTAPRPAPMVGQASTTSPRDNVVTASRWRTVDRSLPTGVAPERGLQVKTILTARAISDAFPQIRNIGGVRPDALRWHPNGLALDVMIPNPGSDEGIALGNQIVLYVMKNAARFGMQDAIWRGVYYTPNGAQRGGGYGHYDHVHITTTGGGYPAGDENYFR